MNLAHYTEKANDFVRDVAFELGDIKNEPRAWRVTGAVFHTLRERLPVEESFDLLSQLPILLKGVYVDGWNPSRKVEPIRTAAEFIERVKQKERFLAPHDLGEGEEAKKAVGAVFRTLKRRISKGEADDIKSSLPEHLREFWLAA